MPDTNEAAEPIAPLRQRTASRAPAPVRGANVPAVARAARVLGALAAAKQAMTLAALVKALGLPKSTVHGLCATLAQAGLVERLDNGSYQLGTRVMDLAHAYMARTDAAAEFQAVLDEALRDYIDRQQKARPRRHVMASFASSLGEFDSLYRELAK